MISMEQGFAWTLANSGLRLTCTPATSLPILRTSLNRMGLRRTRGWGVSGWAAVPVAPNDIKRPKTLPAAAGFLTG